MERKVVHIEPGAIAALRRAYAELIPAGSEVLDLMSSWRSHLPEGLGRVTGIGMNAAEMVDNPQLDAVVVHDLNRSPALPFASGSFDAVVCAVSVQYLIRPIEVFANCARVLRPRGLVVVSFSNRCFLTKAIRAWLAGSNLDHLRLVLSYLEGAGFVDVSGGEVPSPDDRLFVARGNRRA